MCAYTTEQKFFHSLMNLDESKVEPYQVPNPLIALDGTHITTPDQWIAKRRPEVLHLFEEYMYGRKLPDTPIYVLEMERSSEAYEGKATRIQTQIRVAGQTLHVVLYLPNQAKQPVPCFLGLNFTGNHAAFDDPAIPISSRWVSDEGHKGVINCRSTEESRGTASSRWPIHAILGRGYGVATVHYADIEPDPLDGSGYREGARPYLLGIPSNEARNADDAGSIGTWAWGLSRIMDYLVTVPEINPQQICLTGHSRLGKTALWAAACDPRFALVISNNSGCGGASFSRRNWGETPYILSHIRPHWFCKNCFDRSHDIHSFPIDQHMLIGLIAPRPVFVSSAEKDWGADFKGEFVSARHARPVYELFGKKGLEIDEMPPLNQPVFADVGYWIRSGGHDITPADWEVHLDFADLHLKK
jgi:hypothetical protein